MTKAKKSIAKAYVQILPTAENISYGIEKELSSLPKMVNDNLGKAIKDTAAAASKDAGGSLDTAISTAATDACKDFEKKVEEAAKEGGTAVNKELTANGEQAATKVGEKLDKELSEGSSTGTDFGTSFAAAAIAAIAAAKIGEFFSSALTAGGELQQSLGGVETMFSDNADTVIANAEKAYTTAGVSANSYMEQVTGFSATLLQGLGGDTAKAAAVADMAITDMSDNANKFGTSIESIQHAYQGIARDSYVMLDNLKLGYGGTAGEMARLVNDTKVLGDNVTVTATTVKDVPFDKIIEAIHMVQEDLGVTGTTSLEAATTFQGSFKSMQSASENFLGALTTGAGDVSESFDALLESTKTFVGDNVIPMLDNLVTGLRTIDGMGGTVASTVMGLVEAFAMIQLNRMIIPAITTLKNQLAAAKTEGLTLKTALSGAGGLNIAIMAAMTTGQLLASAMDKATAAVKEAPPPYETLTESQLALVDATNEVARSIGSNTEERQAEIAAIDDQCARNDELLARLAVLNSVQVLDEQQKAEIAAIVDELNTVYKVLNLQIDANTGKIKDNNKLLETQVYYAEQEEKKAAYGKQLNDIYADRADVLEAYNDIQAEYNAAKEYEADLEEELAALKAKNPDDMREPDYTRIRDINQALADNKDTIADLASTYSEAGEALRAVEDEYGKMENFYKSTEITSTMAQMSLDAEELALEWRNVGTAITELWGAYGELETQYTEQLSGSLDLFSRVPEQTAVTAQDLQANLDNWLSMEQTWIDEMELLTADPNISDGLIEELRQMGWEALPEMQALNSMTDEQLAEYSGRWEEAHSKSEEAAKAGLQRTRNQVSEQVNALQDEARAKQAGLGETYEQMGEMIGDGLAQGIINKSDEAYTAAWNMMKGVEDTMREAAGIQSPSRVARDLAVYIPEGVALGITDGVDTVARAATGMMSQAMAGLNGASLPLCIYDISPAGRAAMTTPQAPYSAAAQAAEGGGRQAVFNLVVDGKVMARAVAADLDEMSGADILLRERGVAT